MTVDELVTELQAEQAAGRGDQMVFFHKDRFDSFPFEPVVAVTLETADRVETFEGVYPRKCVVLS